jgi:hypothetical protein
MVARFKGIECDYLDHRICPPMSRMNAKKVFDSRMVSQNAGTFARQSRQCRELKKFMEAELQTC